ncbi:hypothetical protein MKC49_04565 [[Clostridium] innocuum]|nr:hypothetical protein [[Clostridium] innocuum]MCR0466861.1 hypothetical protein [[Clostridium] innocuum]MCR0475308.1 hypothetical protein [[Clostridium] innocuum]
MTSTKKANHLKNLEKECLSAKPYEIVQEEHIDDEISINHEDIVLELGKLLISHGLNYFEMNEVLYQTDKVLREKALRRKFIN